MSEPQGATAKQGNPMKPRITERDFQAQVITLAQMTGWRVAHFRASLNQRGNWQTAVAGDGAGFPDLVLARERVLFVELKTDTGKLARNQAAWRDALQTAGAEHRVWRPSDWQIIEQTLMRSTP